MIVGASLDAGASEEYLRAELDKLGLEDSGFDIEKVNKKGIAATSFQPRITEHNQQHGHQRHLADIKKMIESAELSDRVKQQAVEIFGNLARAEAKVHGSDEQKMRFHEVGALDAIMDIVGACVVLELLGIEKVYCSALAVGSGTIKCEHGVLPAPAPATAELIKGIDIIPSTRQAELLTPTGAAILTTWAAGFGQMPAMRIDAIGYGAGQRDYPGLPNVLRLMVGEGVEDQSTACESDEVWVLAANIDDASGELIGYVTEQLQRAGALDVYCTAITMKKNRPATQINVICRLDDVGRLERTLFLESTTLGIRRHICQRSVLSRGYETVSTAFGKIKIKTGCYDGKVVTSSVEFADCQAAAKRHSIAVKEVVSAALAEYQRLVNTSKPP